MSGIDANKKKVVESYVAEVNKHFSAGIATEHTYRPALTVLLKALLPKFIVMNEPARIECGAPDLILARDANGVPVSVAFVEAKDIGDSDLDGNRQHKEQFNRYKKSLDHILFTDYLDFHLYEGEIFIDSVRLAETKGNKIVIVEDNILKFLEMVESLSGATPQKITSPKKMAEMMANKARLLADVVERTLAADTEKNGELAGQWKSFQKVLIHDLTERQFADIYAQTICYGMFAARLHDETPDTFSRNEAANLVPKTNPFLRSIFQNIAGYDIDESIVWIVDDLIESFRVTDIHRVMSNFGKSTAQTDPMIHFYEDFLRYYDPKQKKACGVYYTPEPVVKFIVNAVDEILQKDFNLPDGIADTSKVQLDRVVDGTFDKKSKDHKVHEKREYHKVQILDPATGTGTFLAEVVKKIHSKMKGQQGAWQSYVEEHLLPRLNGFEFMMAPYAVAHLKLDMILGDTGYKATKDKRLRVFLTNSLEEYDPDTGTLFAQWLAQEANEANFVKRDTPVMVMIGNPPYSGISTNNGEWITSLIEDYKYIDGIHFNERKHWLNDDYVKFIRLAEEYVNKNEFGILAYINNHSFIDNPTFRCMRYHLMNSFDKIYILNLHGNSKTGGICPDGSKDENVFDIQQGVSINIFVKDGSAKGKLASVFYHELFGKRTEKYDFLNSHNFRDVAFEKINPNAPYYFFVPKTDEGREEYEKGFSLNEIAPINTTGVLSMGDAFAVADTKKELVKRLSDFLQNEYSESSLTNKFSLGKNYANFVLETKNKGFIFDENRVVAIDYRPFDVKWTYYDNRILWRIRDKVSANLIKNDNNFALISCRQIAGSDWSHVSISNKIVDDSRISNKTKERGYVYPLYLYSDENSLLDSSPSAQNDTGEITQNGNGLKRKPNLNEEIWRKIDECIQIPGQAGNDIHATTPEQIFDYIYGVLHTPSYREKYKEFLKVDFPRIPYPENAEKFFQIVALGNKLRKLHLMEEIPQCQTSFDVAGDNTVTELRYEPADTSKKINDRVFINKTQYFDNVPELAWNFYIGGYQPAQKWLKDRKGRTLSYDDISHYRKIIAILIETDNLMKQLDSI